MLVRSDAVPDAWEIHTGQSDPREASRTADASYVSRWGARGERPSLASTSRSSRAGERRAERAERRQATHTESRQSEALRATRLTTRTTPTEQSVAKRRAPSRGGCNRRRGCARLRLGRLSCTRRVLAAVTATASRAVHGINAASMHFYALLPVGCEYARAFTRVQDASRFDAIACNCVRRSTSLGRYGFRIPNRKRGTGRAQ
jgi:hypothetical protein